MEKRIDKLTGAGVSLLGFGCMRLPVEKAGEQKIDEREAFKLFDKARAGGVNYYDTAWVYHAGESETVLGKWLKTIDRKSVYVADKMPEWETKNRKDAERIFAEQLKKTQAEYFDFYLVHALDDDNFESMKRADIYEFLTEQKKAGKIKRLGFSFHGNPALFDVLLKNYKWDFVQIQLNYIDWEFQNSGYYYRELEKRGIPVIVMEPVRGGLLAAPCKESVEIFKKAAPEYSVASWALRYVGSFPGVQTVLSGMSTAEQVEDNLKTFNNFKPLSDGERKVIERALAAYKKFSSVPCTACNYCSECPQGIRIPDIFKAYNAHKQGEAGFKAAIEKIAENARPEKCVNCRRCVQMCPQKIEIPAELKKAANLYDIL